MKRLLFALFLIAPALGAAEVEISAADSVFAVITHKAGFASGRAHNHLIAAAGERARLDFDPQDPLATRFQLELAADRLAVDPWDLEQAWYPRLAELGVLDEPFTEVSDKDRDKIREAMLDQGQLDAASFPEIAARVTGVEARAATHGEVELPYTATLELEVRGRKVAKPVAARYRLRDGILTIEALGAFLFTDFGIKPYSAFLGAVKNQDRFHVYVHLEGSLP